MAAHAYSLSTGDYKQSQEHHQVSHPSQSSLFGEVVWRLQMETDGSLGPTGWLASLVYLVNSRLASNLVSKKKEKRKKVAPEE